MDKHLQQTFNIRNLKIGGIVNSGVLQIGCVAAVARKKYSPSGYTTIGTKLMPLSTPTQFVVPLQAPKSR